MSETKTESIDEQYKFVKLGVVEEQKEEITVSTYELTLDAIQDIDLACDYVRKIIDQNDQFQFVTKAKIIRMLAEKYKALQYPILSIIDEICKQLGTRITRNNVLGCLGPEYKRENRVAAGKESAISRNINKQKLETVEELEDTVTEPITSGVFSSDGGDADFEEKDIVMVTGDTIKSQELQKIIDEQEKQIKALKGEIQYTEMTAFEKWRKFDKAQALKLDTVSKASISDIWVLIDIRTGEVMKTITDKEHDKMLKNKSKNK